MKALREIYLHAEERPLVGNANQQNQFQLNQNFKELVETISLLEQRIDDLEALLKKEE